MQPQRLRALNAYPESESTCLRGQRRWARRENSRNTGGLEFPQIWDQIQWESRRAVVYGSAPFQSWETTYQMHPVRQGFQKLSHSDVFQQDSVLPGELLEYSAGLPEH